MLKDYGKAKCRLYIVVCCQYIWETRRPLPAIQWIINVDTSMKTTFDRLRIFNLPLMRIHSMKNTPVCWNSATWDGAGGGAEIHGFVWLNQTMWPTAGNNFHFMKCDIAKNRTQVAAMPTVWYSRNLGIPEWQTLIFVPACYFRFFM